MPLHPKTRREKGMKVTDRKRDSFEQRGEKKLKDITGDSETYTVHEPEAPEKKHGVFKACDEVVKFQKNGQWSLESKD